MIFVPMSSRRRRGPRRQAAAIVAAMAALAAALGSIFHRTARGFPRQSFAGESPWLLWVLGGVAVVVVMAVIVMLVVRSRDGDDGRDDHSEGDDARDDDFRQRKMAAIAVCIALAASLVGAAFYARARRGLHAPSVPVPTSTSIRP